MRCKRLSDQLRLALAAAAIACGFTLSCNPQQTTTQNAPAQYDLLIKGGRIIDGSGSPWYQGDVAVKNGKIAAIGRLVNPTARCVIDATGLVVAPGFIDLHTHSDYTLLVDGDAQSKIRQGVTTEIIGEDASAGPFTSPSQPDVSKSSRPPGFKRNWETLAQYFDVVRAERHLAERGFLRGRGTGVDGRDWKREPPADAGGNEKDGGPCSTGHAAGRHRPLLGTHLPAQLVHDHGRSDPPGQRGGALRRHLHQPHPGRGCKRTPGFGGSHRDRQEGPPARPHSPLQDGRQTELGPRHRPESGSSRRRATAASKSPPTSIPTSPP